jgi:hypothetical protein
MWLAVPFYPTHAHKELIVLITTYYRIDMVNISQWLPQFAAERMKRVASNNPLIDHYQRRQFIT